MTKRKQQTMPITAPLCVLGGPAYRLLVDARHADSMMMLAVKLAGMGCGISPLHKHGTPISAARNYIFEMALTSSAEVLLTMDSDCFIAPTKDAMTAAATVVIGAKLTSAPAIALPVPCRDGRPNISRSRTHVDRWSDYAELPQSQPQPAEVVGTGFVAYRLDYYRQPHVQDAWADDPWFRDDWNGKTSTSEDYWHSLKLAELGTPMEFIPNGSVIQHGAEKGQEL